jgi:hypothetical protein
MNSRRILVILVLLLAFAAVAEALTIWVFWRSPWTPIERHYLPPYIWCSLPVITPETVEVRLIWKTGRRRKRQLATDDDAVDSTDGIGMALSQSALNAGWKTLVEGPRQQVPADQLRRYLASLAFEGQSLGALLLFPELSALAALFVALCAWFLVIGFLRALIAEYAWRRRLYSRQELLSTLFKDCTAFASRFCCGLEALYQSAGKRIETHWAAPSLEIAQTEPPVRPASFPFPLFGLYSGTGDGRLWSERDEID